MADIQYGLDDLVDDVGARLDIGNPTTSTTPTNDQIEMWLNLAQLDIMAKAVDDAIPTLWAERTIVATGWTAMKAGVDYVWKMSSVLNADFVRPVSVELWKNPISETTVYPVLILAKEMSLAFLKNTLYATSNSRPVGWFWNNNFYIAMGDKNDADELHIFYIKQPDLMESAETTELPLVFQEYMVQFAVIKAKIQDGKMEEIPALSAAYEQGIQMINMQAAQSYYGIGGR